MSKKPIRPKTTSQPEPAQFKAIECLLGARDYPHAIERARALVKRFPDHGGANALLLKVLAEADRPIEALLAAWEWASHRPRSIDALQALLECALARGCAVLALRTAERLAELGVEARSAALDPARLDALLRNPDGTPMGRDEAQRFEIGKLHLEAGDFAGAVRASTGAGSTPARNNLALALFNLGRIEEARDTWLDTWQRDPGNLFGLSGVLAMRLYLGDATGAAGLAVPLTQAEPRRAEDAQGQLHGLLLIGEDQAAWDAFERARAADWAQDATGRMAAAWLELAGGAAARVGDEVQARTLWRRALKLRPNLVAAAENLAAWEGSAVTSTCPALFEAHQVLPFGWLQRVRDANPTNLEARFAALTASDAYLKAVYLGGVAHLRTVAGLLLSQGLKPAPDTAPPLPRRPGAAAILRDLARRPVGTREERVGLLQALRNADLIGQDEEVEYWDGKAISRAMIFSTEIYREPDPADFPVDLPDDLQTLFDESVDLIHQGRLEAAAQRLDTILTRVPDHPRALGNLATIRARQGRPQDCLETLRHVVAIHPDYLMARCNLATLLIENGEIEAAKDAIDGLVRRPRMHIEDYFALYGVMAMLAQVQGEPQAADRIIASLQQMTETAEDQRMLATAKARVARVRANASPLDALRALMARSRRSG